MPPRLWLPGKAGVRDANFSSVSLLAHGDGANAGTVFTDSSSFNRTLTRTGTVTTSTTQSKFGGASLNFPAGGSWLQAADAAALQLSGDFTMEFWVYAASYTDLAGIFSKRDVGFTGQSWYVRCSSVGPTIGLQTATTAFQGLGVMSTSTWHHCAFSRASGTCKGFLNGSQVFSTAMSEDFSAAGIDLQIGTNFSGAVDFTGYLDDIRITKGVGRYTGSFTAPSAPFPNF